MNVPDEKTTSNGPTAAQQSGQATADRWNETVPEPRYLALRPTCERPPGMVINIQVNALRNNNPATDAGINTTWQFATPANREAVGSYQDFRRLIKTRFQPLLHAEKVTYDPLQRNDMIARQDVTVTTTNGTIETYRWTLEQQTTGRYEGCWLTTSVAIDPPPRLE